MIKAAVPEGSRFKGHEPLLVQDLVISAQATRYQRERWVTPDGRTILAALPEGIEGHFGPELRRFVLMQYHQGQCRAEPAAAGMDRLFRLQPMARVGLTGRLDTAAPALRRLGPVEDARQTLQGTPSPQGLREGGQCGHLQSKGTLAAELGERDAPRLQQQTLQWVDLGWTLDGFPDNLRCIAVSSRNIE